VIEAGPKFFIIKCGNSLETISVDRLKAHQGQEEVVPAVPAPRGRPRRPDGPSPPGGVQPPSGTSEASTGGALWQQ
jgi:hypothetical protein